MKTLLFTSLLLIALLPQNLFAQSTAKELVFNIEVSTSLSPASITLKWNTQTGVTAYNILKKNRNEKTFTAIATNIPASVTTFTDHNIVVGTGYEYCVQSSMNADISGYVYAGIQLPVVHQSGEIMLVVDNTYQVAAAQELEAYKLDLVKEGWKVKTIFVARNQPVTEVKQLIVDEYVKDPSSLKGVILLGHVPVPYSGKIAPDAHSNHIGAWPSDMYYGDIMVGPGVDMWTDLTLNVVSASDTRNYNVVGDGKFDMSNKATVAPVKLFIGRIDVYNMPSINSDDIVLFKQYLAKNHTYRAGLKKFKHAGIIDDNFGYFSGEAFAQNGWRNFASLIGSSKITEGDYVSGTKNDSYIWSYACGPGWYTGAQGIGTTNDFASNQMQSVFTMIYGSYFGDWDNQDNFLRAPIASPSSSLVSVWGGRPNWFFHTMAMGEPIGYSYLNSIDNANTYFPKGFYANKVHQSLQGDPTLKMYMFEAPTNVITSAYQSDKVKINWTASVDPEVLGYYVYRASGVNEEFVLLNTGYVTGNEFIDETQNLNSEAIYMVKAVKLQASTTGTFYNLSPGAMSLDNPLAISLPVNITAFNGVMNSDKTNTLFWVVNNEINLAGYELQRSVNAGSFTTIGFVAPATQVQSENSYSFVDEHPALESSYRLKSIDVDGRFVYSNIIHLQRVETSLPLTIYPSPFSDHLSITYNSDMNSTLNIQLVDLNGHIVFASESEVHEGQNTIQFDQLDRLTQGVYVVVVLNTTSNERKMFKVIKE